MINISDFEEVKKKGESAYQKFGRVYCPYFKDTVAFSVQGFGHLKFKNRLRARSKQDQYMRFKLISLAPEVIRRSSTLQGLLETKKFEKIKIHSRVDTVLKEVAYFEFIALIGRSRVKVIVKQIDGGEKFFWSLIPFWGMNNETKSRIFVEGFPEED